MTPAQCKEKCPLLNVSDIKGGLWIPGDGVGDPYETCMSVVNEAKRLGKYLILFITWDGEMLETVSKLIS